MGLFLDIIFVYNLFCIENVLQDHWYRSLEFLLLYCITVYVSWDFWNLETNQMIIYMSCSQFNSLNINHFINRWKPWYIISIKNHLDVFVLWLRYFYILIFVYTCIFELNLSSEAFEQHVQFHIYEWSLWTVVLWGLHALHLSSLNIETCESGSKD